MSVASEGCAVLRVVEPAVPNEANPAVPVKPDSREGLAKSLSLSVGSAVFMNCVPYVGFELRY